jgi:MEMO1 family protein
MGFLNRHAGAGPTLIAPTSPASVRRPAYFAGRSYFASPPMLSAQLAGYFDHVNGSGTPQLSSGRRPVRAVLSPHIDFFRGGTAYTWAYRELAERSDADVFVILGVAHAYCSQRYILTRQDFDTPLGPVTTDRAFVDRIAAEAGADLFDEEPVHATEHSIEFQAVFLRYLFGNRRPFSIVPILVGSFHDLMRAGIDPIESPDVRRFVSALQSAEAASGKRVAYIGAVDLCHVGPEFGDPSPVDDPMLRTVETFDSLMLDRAQANDPAGWFRTAGQVGNRLRVCGLAATYTMLHAIGPARGRLLQYRQAVDAARTCCVSFASMVFDGVDPSG